MRNHLYPFGIVILLLLGSVSIVEASEIRDRLVKAAGADRFQEVDVLIFTFNVERNGQAAGTRTWLWEPMSQRVTRIVAGRSRTYHRHRLEAADREVDAQFINDTFWLSPALHLSWAGEDVTIEDTGEVAMPIGDGRARRVVVTYPASGGGYTPGDVYDLFVDDNDMIVAWHFRRGGSAEPSLTCTFSDYMAAGPLRIATEHRNADGSFRLFFTNVIASVRDEP